MLSRSIKIVVGICLVYVLAVNFVFFSLSQDLFENNNWNQVIIFSTAHADSEYKFRGFKYFYEYLSTFPGLTNSLQTVNNVVSVLTNDIHYTGYTALDWFLGILMILGSPVQMLFCLVLDIMNNLIWLFQFFLPHAFA